MSHKNVVDLRTLEQKSKNQCATAGCEATAQANDIFCTVCRDDVVAYENERSMHKQSK